MSTDKDSFDIVSTDSLLPDQIKQVTLEQRGSYNTQIAQAHIENVDRSTNFFIGQPSANQQNALCDTSVSMDRTHYNLFVIDGEDYTGSSFSVQKSMVLTIGTPVEIRKAHIAFTPESMSIIKSFPALFCSPNHCYATTDSAHMAHYGIITGIFVHETDIKVTYQILNRNISQQLIIALSNELHIEGAKSFTELSETHWAIKPVDLITVIEKTGCRLFKI